MKVSVRTRKLIKPVTPTPPNLKTYHISLPDVTAPPINMPVVLYYPSAANQMNYQENNNIKKLEESLGKILPYFYPLAGRYIRQDRVVDCNDQGIEFMEAEVDDVDLRDVVQTYAAENQLDDLLPRGIWAHEDIRDPLLSVQVTGFRCGGMAIGVSMSHRITDGCSLSIFISHWANACKHGMPMLVAPPNFNNSSLFPANKGSMLFEGDDVTKVLHDIETSLSYDPRLVSRRFLFKREAIIAQRQIVPEGKANTRVRIVCALLAKALHRANGQSKACRIAQAVSIRRRTNPPLPPHSCGNLSISAVTPRFNAENVELQDLVRLLSEAVEESIANCACMFAREDNWRRLFVDREVGLFQEQIRGDVTFMYFSDCTKFGSYELDFGWGKPIWTSFGTMDAANVVLLIDDKDGSGGIEAWVTLDRDCMPYLEQDDEIRKFAMTNQFTTQQNCLSSKY